MLGSITLNSIKLFFSLLAVIASSGLTLLMIVTNYLATKVSFELLGYDQVPLNLDRLLGGFFRGFTGKATLTDLFALVVSITITAGMFFFFHLIFKFTHLLNDQRAYMLEGDTTSFEIIRQRIWFHLGIAVVISIFLGFGIWWDISLFLFRNVAGALSLTDPELALRLSKWSIQVNEKADLWFISLSQIGAWGYFSITAISCLCLEYAIYKLRECIVLLIQATGQNDPDDPGGSNGLDYHHRTNETDDQAVPNNLFTYQARKNDRYHQTFEEPLNNTSNTIHPNSTTSDNEDRSAQIFDQMAINFPPTTDQTEPNDNAQNQEQKAPVIGSKNKKQASRSRAKNNKNQIVDPTDHKTVWDADYYNALFDESNPHAV